MALSPKQRKFADAYTGNGVEAARAAGYTGTEAALAVTASRLLRQAKIKALIDGRLQTDRNPLIADRQARQEWWTALMNNPDADYHVRLKASELLGKSQADFTEKVQVSGTVTLESLVSHAYTTTATVTGSDGESKSFEWKAG